LEQRVAERTEALRASEALLTAVVDALPVGVLLADAAGQFTLVNAETRRLVGGDTTGSAYGPRGGYTLHHSDGTPFTTDELPMPRALADHQPVTDVEILIRPEQGEETIVLAAASPVCTPEGRLLGVVATLQDITARKRTEAALREQQAFLRTVIDTVPNFIGVKHWDGQFVLANRALTDVYGTTPEAIVGKTDADFNPNAEEVAWFRRDDQEVMRTCAPKHIPLERVTDSAGRVRWLSTVKVPLVDKDGGCHHVLLATHDITTMHDLQEQQRALLQTVSHDLRLPLTTIQGHAQLIRIQVEQRGLDDTLRPSLDAILRATQRMNGMIQDLVDAARIEGGHLRLQRQPVHLPAYLRDLLRRNAAILEAERIRIDAPDDLPAVFADYDRLERIMTNLLTNALKYSTPGTPVLVRARARPDVVEVSVTDQGRGIPPEALPHLFERFFRAPGPNGQEGLGLGLGLYIAKLLVDAHGGHIHVDSTVGQGTTFTFTLPIAPP
jgi:PAS domain S-box-containing protein